MDLVDVAAILGCVFLALVFLPYLVYDQIQRRKTKPWRELAASNNLTYHRPSKFFKGQDVVSGIYRGYHLKLEILGERIGKEEGYTSIILSTNDPGNGGPARPGKGLRLDILDTLEPLQVFTASHNLRGQIIARRRPEIIEYQQHGVEADKEYLQSVVDLLFEIANASVFALALEGKAIPILQKAVNNNKHMLRPIALQLIEDITKAISVRLSDSNANLFCMDCLAHYKTHHMNLPWLQSIDYYGCRLCHSTQDYFEGKVVAVLDRTTKKDSFQQDGVLRINWLTQRALFDFDEVNIIQATDEEVERFAVQVGNDTDPFRKPKYKEMLCLIDTNCDLSENTRRILRRIFGQVVTKR